MNWKKVFKPTIGKIIISIILVIIIHFISKFCVCGGGSCFANYVYNNYLIYILIFMIAYIIYGFIFNKLKK